MFNSTTPPRLRTGRWGLKTTHRLAPLAILILSGAERSRPGYFQSKAVPRAVSSDFIHLCSWGPCWPLNIRRRVGLQDTRQRLKSNNKEEPRGYRPKFEGRLVRMLTSRNDDVTQLISDVDPSNILKWGIRRKWGPPNQWNRWSRWSELLPVKTTKPKLFKWFICAIRRFMRCTLISTRGGWHNQSGSIMRFGQWSSLRSIFLSDRRPRMSIVSDKEQLC